MFMCFIYARFLGNTPSSGLKTTSSGVISASCPTAKAITIPDGAEAKYFQWVTDGGTLPSGCKLPFNGQLFDADDIRAAIKRDRNAQGLVTPNIGPDGGVQSPPPGRGQEVMPISLSDAYRRPYGDNGKGRVTTPSPSSDGGKGKGKGRRLEEGTVTPPNSSNAGRCASVRREMKTEHCAPRLITLIVNRYRDRFMSLSETRASRGALDAGAVREKNDIWQAIRNDFVNPKAEIGGALSDDLRFEHIDVNVVTQPNISAHKLRKKWKKVVSKWNDVKGKCRSGDTEPFTDMCEEGDTDTQYMSEALAKEPQLLEFCWAELPEGKGREEGEVEVDREGGGPGDAQRRKERALTSKERTESLGAVRKKARLEKEAVVKSTAAMESACSMLAPHVERVMTSIRSPQNGGEAAPKVSEEHTKRMNDIEFENAKRDKALADEKARAELAKVKLEVFEELLNKYERVEKELKDAEEGGRSPFVIAMLQEMQNNLKSQIIERHK